MEVHVESTGGLARRLQVTIPAESVEQKVNEQLKRLAGRAKIPGFRPGKVPMKVVQQQYGDTVRHDVIGELLHTTWPEALAQTKMQPAAIPKFEVTAEKQGEPLVYVASFEVLPEVKLDHLDQLKIQKPVVEITEADVDRLIENLRKARRTQAKVERAAKEGDAALVDFAGTLEGQPFQGGEGKDVEIEIGTRQFLPDFENALIGHTAGESFAAEVNFPADYRAENLRGKTAQFQISLHEVREFKLPEMDEEFLRGHGVAEGGVEGLRAKCRSALEGERDKATRARVKRELMDQLLAAHPLEVPKTQVEPEIERMRQEAMTRMGMNQDQRKIEPEQLAKMLPDVLFEAGAQRRVALGLLVSQLVKSRNIEIDQGRVEQALNGIAADYDEPEQVKQHYRSRSELMNGLRSVVLEEQAVEVLLAGAQSSDLAMSLEDLLKSQGAPAA